MMEEAESLFLPLLACTKNRNFLFQLKTRVYVIEAKETWNLIFLTIMQVCKLWTYHIKVIIGSKGPRGWAVDKVISLCSTERHRIIDTGNFEETHRCCQVVPGNLQSLSGSSVLLTKEFNDKVRRKPEDSFIGVRASIKLAKWFKQYVVMWRHWRN